MDIRRRVFANLSRFKDHIGEFPPQESHPRAYSILLDLETGEMRFSGKINSFQFRWRPSLFFNKGKQVKLLVIDRKTGSPLFRMEGDPPHDSDGVVKETLDVLNELAEKTQGILRDGLPEKKILENLSVVHAEITKRRIEKLSSWVGNISAEEGEARLILQGAGAYLFRYGSDVSRMVDQMKERYGFDIFPYSLMFVSPSLKVLDRLVLGTPQGWILYGDEPNLGKYTPFEDLQDLLVSIGIFRGNNGK